MALRAGYKGFKKLAPGLKLRRPGTIAIDTDVLNETFPTWEDQAALGSVNLLPIKFAWIKENHIAGTWDGNKYTQSNVSFTFEVDDNGLVTSITGGGGNASADVTVVLVPRTAPNALSYKTGTYFGLGWRPNAAVSGCEIRYFCTRDGSAYVYGDDMGDGVEMNVLATDLVGCLITVSNGKSINGLVFKPQISLSSNAPYAPYAMTNKQLTDAVVPVDVDYDVTTLNANIDTVACAVIRKIGNVNHIRGRFTVGSTQINGWSNLFKIPGAPSVDIGSFNGGLTVAIYDHTTPASSGIFKGDVYQEYVRLSPILTAEHQYSFDMIYLSK